MQRLRELEAELANFERQTLRTITAEQKTAYPAAGQRLPSSVDRVQRPRPVTASACSAC